mmetsp:Transcript_2924/g.4317  ORF Transcript_2924/g.4317 Transcript_2924/m.4317 type:complete len:494 (-) Transcript_2924:1324-2805(-)|eukprot:CAMPEP_0194206030 /NCGR_PEP_ID=MMETSP0156-20130528/5165_1 /TAXON_ID=33649 /ORGANISM="Thalassionema nitzschioides, Strain L26-B" /LENGTH=493 /DNA_ID=CAMNT_0038932451 /DNA_START=105 /DNA_END=1586 /DNA_ORIENTATION=-
MVSLAERLRNTKENHSASQSNAAASPSTVEDPFASFENDRPSTSGSFGFSHICEPKPYEDEVTDSERKPSEENHSVNNGNGNSESITASPAPLKTSAGGGLALFKRGPKSSKEKTSKQLSVNNDPEGHTSKFHLNTTPTIRDASEDDASFMPPPPPRPVLLGMVASKSGGVNSDTVTPLRCMPSGDISEANDERIEESLASKLSFSINPHEEGHATKQRHSSSALQSKATFSSPDYSSRSINGSDESRNQLSSIHLQEDGCFAETPCMSKENEQDTLPSVQGNRDYVPDRDCVDDLGTANEHVTKQSESSATYDNKANNSHTFALQVEKPPEGGTSVDKEMVTPDRQMNDQPPMDMFPDATHGITPNSTPVEPFYGSRRCDTLMAVQNSCSVVTPDVQNEHKKKTLPYEERDYDYESHGDFDEMLTVFLTDLQDIKDRHNISEEEMLEMDVKLDVVYVTIQEEILQMQEMQDTLDELDQAYEEILALAQFEEN